MFTIGYEGVKYAGEPAATDVSTFGKYFKRYQGVMPDIYRKAGVGNLLRNRYC